VSPMMELLLKLAGINFLVLLPIVYLLVQTMRGRLNGRTGAAVIGAFVTVSLLMSTVVIWRYGMQSAEGYPMYASADDLPRHIKIKGYTVTPPDPNDTSKRGAIYILGVSDQYSESGIRRLVHWFMYNQVADEPRVYRLPYSYDLERAMQQSVSLIQRKDQVEAEVMSRQEADEQRQPSHEQRPKSEDRQKNQDEKLDQMLKSAQQAVENAKQALKNQEDYRGDEARKSQLQSNADQMDAAGDLLSDAARANALKQAAEALKKSSQSYDAARQQRKDREQTAKQRGRDLAKKALESIEKLVQSQDTSAGPTATQKLKDLAQSAKSDINAANRLFNGETSYYDNPARAAERIQQVAHDMGVIAGSVPEGQTQKLSLEVSQLLDDLARATNRSLDSEQTAAAEKLAKEHFKDADAALEALRKALHPQQDQKAQKEAQRGEEARKKEQSELRGEGITFDEGDRRRFNKVIVEDHIIIFRRALPEERKEPSTK